MSVVPAAGQEPESAGRIISKDEHNAYHRHIVLSINFYLLVQALPITWPPEPKCPWSLPRPSGVPSHYAGICIFTTAVLRLCAPNPR